MARAEPTIRSTKLQSPHKTMVLVYVSMHDRERFRSTTYERTMAVANVIIYAVIGKVLYFKRGQTISPHKQKIRNHISKCRIEKKYFVQAWSTFHLFTTFASVLYRIYNLSPSARYKLNIKLKFSYLNHMIWYNSFDVLALPNLHEFQQGC